MIKSRNMKEENICGKNGIKPCSEVLERNQRIHTDKWWTNGGSPACPWGPPKAAWLGVFPPGREAQGNHTIHLMAGFLVFVCIVWFPWASLPGGKTPSQAAFVHTKTKNPAIKLKRAMQKSKHTKTVNTIQVRTLSMMAHGDAWKCYRRSKLISFEHCNWIFHGSLLRGNECMWWDFEIRTGSRHSCLNSVSTDILFWRQWTFFGQAIADDCQVRTGKALTYALRISLTCALTLTCPLHHKISLTCALTWIRGGGGSHREQGGEQGGRGGCIGNKGTKLRATSS